MVERSSDNVTGHNRATARDVARLAGVSVATVSRALSRPELVRPDKLDAVRQAAEKLKYVMHGVGRALSSRHTGLIGLILPTLEHAMWAKSINTLQRSVSQDGYTLAIACSEFDPGIEMELARRLIEHGTDGIVLCGIVHRPELLQLLRNVRIPHVYIWAFEPNSLGTCIGFEDRKAVTLVVDHLVGLGHRDIGIIMGSADGEWQRTRRRCLTMEFERHGLDLQNNWIIEGAISFETGRKGAKAILTQTRRPSAIICGHDIIAVGAAAICAEMGVAVPNDVSLTGFEDLELASNVVPSLTTVHFPATEIGQVAGTQILRAIDGTSNQGQIELPVSLVVRSTTSKFNSDRALSVVRDFEADGGNWMPP